MLPHLERSTNGLTQLHFDLVTDKVEALDRLALEAGVGTRKELLSNALTLLEWAVRQVKRGRTIAAIDDREERITELNMPFLSTLSDRRGL